jgi:hypothetical protein
MLGGQFVQTIQKQQGTIGFAERREVAGQLLQQRAQGVMLCRAAAAVVGKFPDLPPNEVLGFLGGICPETEPGVERDGRPLIRAPLSRHSVSIRV